jgi:hypothetical protein
MVQILKQITIDKQKSVNIGLVELKIVDYQLFSL